VQNRYDSRTGYIGAKNSQIARFVGSAKQDRAFYSTLNPEQKQTYAAAVQDRKDMAEMVLKALADMPQEPERPRRQGLNW